MGKKSLFLYKLAQSKGNRKPTLPFPYLRKNLVPIYSFAWTTPSIRYTASKNNQAQGHDVMTHGSLSPQLGKTGPALSHRLGFSLRIARNEVDGFHGWLKDCELCRRGAQEAFFSFLNLGFEIRMEPDLHAGASITLLTTSELVESLCSNLPTPAILHAVSNMFHSWPSLRSKICHQSRPLRR